MKFLENLFAFYINSSIHVSLAVASLFLISTAKFNIAIDYNLLFFIFFGSITGYNFVKYAGVAKLHHKSLAKSLKLIQIFSFFCFGFFIYFSFQISFETLCVSGFFGLLTLFYALPIFPKHKNLRSLSRFKIFVIAVVWAGTTVVIPFFNAENAVSTNMFIEFFQRLLFVLVITLPFEIRDLKYDDTQLQTIPQEFGISKTKKIGFALLLVSVALEFIQPWQPKFVIAYLLTSVLASYLLFRSTLNQPKYYASFFVEALPIFWLLLIVIIDFYL